MSGMGVGRSVELLRAFRLEQSAPEVFYGTLARDTVVATVMSNLGFRLALSSSGIPQQAEPNK